MNLFDKISARIEYIRSQPESVKVKIIWTWALGIIIAIAAIWIIFFWIYDLPSKNDAVLFKNSIKTKIEEKVEKYLNGAKMPELPAGKVPESGSDQGGSEQ